MVVQQRHLDQCNGANVDGTYAYFATEEYPFVGRCLQGLLEA